MEGRVPEATPIGALVMEVTRGSSNNFFQVATLVRAATALEATVQVLFRGDAVVKLRRDHINLDEWTSIYEPVRDSLRERLRAAEFVDMEGFLRDAKEHGNEVKFWVSEETLRAEDLTLDRLVASIDGALSDEEFARFAGEARISLTF